MPVQLWAVFRPRKPPHQRVTEPEVAIGLRGLQ
jgi:hypothetical protein